MQLSSAVIRECRVFLHTRNCAIKLQSIGWGKNETCFANRHFEILNLIQSGQVSQDGSIQELPPGQIGSPSQVEREHLLEGPNLVMEPQLAPKAGDEGNSWGGMVVKPSTGPKREHLQRY